MTNEEIIKILERSICLMALSEDFDNSKQIVKNIDVAISALRAQDKEPCE